MTVAMAISKYWLNICVLVYFYSTSLVCVDAVDQLGAGFQRHHSDEQGQEDDQAVDQEAEEESW